MFSFFKVFLGHRDQFQVWASMVPEMRPTSCPILHVVPALSEPVKTIGGQVEPLKRRSVAFSQRDIWRAVHRTLDSVSGSVDSGNWVPWCVMFNATRCNSHVLATPRTMIASSSSMIHGQELSRVVLQ